MAGDNRTMRLESSVLMRDGPRWSWECSRYEKYYYFEGVCNEMFKILKKWTFYLEKIVQCNSDHWMIGVMSDKAKTWRGRASSWWGTWIVCCFGEIDEQYDWLVTSTGSHSDMLSPDETWNRRGFNHHLIRGYMRIKVNVQSELYTPEHICQRRRQGNYVAVPKSLDALMQLPLSVGCNMATRCLTTVIIFRATI